MRIILIVNEHARRGREPLDAALQVLEAAGHSVDVKPVARADDAAAAIRAASGRFDCVVLAGGDGTIHDSAPALLEANLPVGILPRGTANDLARALGLPTGLEEAAQVIATGRLRAIDVGEVNGTPFFNVAHIGLGAALANSLTKGMKRRLGPFAYTVAAARTLSGLRPFRAEVITPDQRVAYRTIGLTIGNGRYFGGSGVVAEDAAIDDGLLHLFALTTKNPFSLALILPRIRHGRQGLSKHVETLVAPSFEVNTVRPLPIRADGAMAGETPATFRVRPAALKVFAPPGG
jgi:diacylglycerol kinase (ATP)